MRALFFADLHLGAGDRLDDQIKVIDRIAKLAHDRDVDTVLFGGDATHRRVATPSELAAFQGLLRDLEVWEIPFLGINGNHDVTTMDAPSTLEVAAEGFKNAMVCSRPDTMPVYRSAMSTTTEAVVACLPWCPTSAISALDHTGHVDDVARTSEELLVTMARGLYHEAVAMDPGKPVVLMLHWSLSGAVTPTGALTDEFREVVLPTAELAEIGFDAILAGHIHTAGTFAPHRVPVIYAGSPAVVDWGEAETRHGVWIVEVGGGGPTDIEFVPIADRPFITVGYDHEEQCPVITDDGTDSYRSAIVRVRYDATPEQERAVSHDAIRQALLAAGVHRVHPIQPQISGQASSRTAVTEDIDVDEALELWVACQEAPDEILVGALFLHQEIKEAVR